MRLRAYPSPSWTLGFGTFIFVTNATVEAESDAQEITIVKTSWEPKPRRSRRSPWSIAICVVLAGVLYCGGVYVLWQPVVDQVRSGESTQNVIKNYYLGDQLTYMSIARNVKEGRPAYEEPFTATGSSIYPSGYYWAQGTFARFTGLNPFSAWDILGILSTFMLLVAAGAWGRFVSRSMWGWLLGPIPLLVGTLRWWDDQTWKTLYGSHAMLWPPAAILFNPGAETPALAIVAFGLLTLVAALRSARTHLWLWFGGAGALMGLAMNVHTYVPMFGLTTATITVATLALMRAPSRKAIIAEVVSVAIAFAIVLSGATSTALGLLALLFIGIIAPIFLVPSLRKQFAKEMLAFYVAVGLAASPVLFRIAEQVGDKNSYFYFRQAIAQTDNLSLPLHSVILETSPVLLAVALCLYWAIRSPERRKNFPLIAAIAGVLGASALLVFNESWGFNQEPYRFYPYFVLFCAALGVPFIAAKITNWKQLFPRAVVVVALLATVPTTHQFYKDTSGLALQIPATQQQTYAKIAAALPAQGVTLLDSCISKRIFKVSTVAEVADFNLGLATPKLYKPIDAVLYEQNHGRLSDDAMLNAAGITSFVTMNYCDGVAADQLQQRFGAPVATVPLPDAEKCGLPADTQYRVYNVNGASESTKFNDVNGFNVTNPFKPGFALTAACALGATY